MLINTLQSLFDRDLRKLKTEIEGYTNEEKLWYTEKQIANSAGNLCLHLIGNLKAFIGAQFGKTNYTRQREMEFTQKNIPKQDLLKMIDETIDIVHFSLAGLTTDDLEMDYPLQVFSEKMTTEYFLVHLATHLSYHLGQINYHRRLLAE